MYYAPNELNGISKFDDSDVFSKNAKFFTREYYQDSFTLDTVEIDVEVYKTKSEAWGVLLTRVISEISILEKIREDVRTKYNNALKSKE